jgi:ubiquinone/menaquinone biosynthesis C-methylase UbiE
VENLKARVYDLGMRLAGRRLASLRQGVVAGATGRVLELGVGTGQNLPFYRAGVTVVAIDPDPAMLRRAWQRCRTSDARVRLVAGAGEALPFPDGAFDEVVATLVFCTVRSPSASLTEVRRVLKPGGRLRFMEHVRSADPRWARLQDLVTPLWKRLADGCCPNRATVATIAAAGFGIESLDQYPLGPYPIRPQVRGTARSDS